MAIITGTNRNDALAAKAAGDRVLGLGGDDRLASQLNRTLLSGGDGRDQLTTDLDLLLGTGPTELVVRQEGGKGDDRMRALSEATGDFDSTEVITSTNRLAGGLGNDLIRSSAALTGTSGVASNIVDAGGGDDRIEAFAGALNFSGVFVIDAFNSIRGGGGNDSIDANAVSDGGATVNEIWGDEGSDSLSASAIASGNEVDPLSNTLDGGAGDDRLFATTEGGTNFAGFEATNTLFGRDGNDDLRAEHSGDAEDFSRTLTNALFGGDGDDTMTGIIDTSEDFSSDIMVARNLLEGGAGNDDLFGRAVARAQTRDAIATNALRGGDGNDSLSAFAAATGGDGDAVLARNTLRGGDGDDQIFGEIGEVAEGGTGLSRLHGDGGDDTLTATGGTGNILDGGAGADTITGSAGEDRIAGGAGDDALLGGADADTFVFDLGANQGTDSLGDFAGAEDVLFFRGIADEGDPGLADDLDAVSSVTDAGAGLDVTVAFASGTVLVFTGLGTGAVESLADLVDDPATQLLAPGLLV